VALFGVADRVYDERVIGDRRVRHLQRVPLVGFRDRVPELAREWLGPARGAVEVGEDVGSSA
jgi:hypothetical protein